MKENLKQKAEAEADKVIVGSGMDRASVIHLKHLLVTMYMQGATENGIQWHDLRKDPNDLPKEDCEVFAIVESDGTLYKSIENYYLDKTDTFDGWGTCQKVIAWLDPQF